MSSDWWPPCCSHCRSHPPNPRGEHDMSWKFWTRYHCPRCGDVMHRKFCRSHETICAWAAHLAEQQLKERTEKEAT